MRRTRTLLIVIAVVIAIGLALHLTGSPAIEWMASLHGRTPAH